MTDEWVTDASESWYFEGWEKQSDTTESFLTDFEFSDDLGFDELSVISVREEGGWLISPLGTYADAASILVEHIAQLEEEGRLEEMLEELAQL